MLSIDIQTVKEVFGFRVFEEVQRQQIDTTEKASTCSGSDEFQDENNLTRRNIWTRNSILRLIHFYKSNELKFKSTTIRNETVFKLIAAELKKEGYNFTGVQCRDKFKYLKMKYTKKLDNMKNTGEPAMHFEYFTEMDEVFGKKPNAVPVAIASSSRGTVPGK